MCPSSRHTCGRDCPNCSCSHLTVPIHGYSEVPRPVFSERSLERNGSRYHDESARGIAQKRHVFLSPPASVASLRLQQGSRALWTIMNAAATMLYSGTCMTTPMSFFQIFTPSMGGCHTIFFLPVLPSVLELTTESNSCGSIVLAWTPSDSFQIHRKVHGHSDLTLGLSGLVGAKSAFQPHQTVSEFCI